jgi:hypothetical protein
MNKHSGDTVNNTRLSARKNIWTWKQIFLNVSGIHREKERERVKRKERDDSIKVFWSTTEQIDFFIFNIPKGKEKKGMGTESLFNDRIAELALF